LWVELGWVEFDYENGPMTMSTLTGFLVPLFNLCIVYNLN